jgi:hypothetical protein
VLIETPIAKPTVEALSMKAFRRAYRERRGEDEHRDQLPSGA